MTGATISIRLDLFGRSIQGWRPRACTRCPNQSQGYEYGAYVHQRPDGAEEGVKCAEGEAGSATGLGCRGDRFWLSDIFSRLSPVLSSAMIAVGMVTPCRRRQKASSPGKNSSPVSEYWPPVCQPIVSHVGRPIAGLRRPKPIAASSFSVFAVPTKSSSNRPATKLPALLPTMLASCTNPTRLAQAVDVALHGLLHDGEGEAHDEGRGQNND